MANKVLGGGSIDGELGVNPAWSDLSIPKDRVVLTLTPDLLVKYYLISDTDEGEGNETANGLYANETTLKTDASVQSVNGKIGVVVLTKSDLGLSNVDDTSDLDKPISTLTQNALDDKATKAELRRVKLITSAAG